MSKNKKVVTIKESDLVSIIETVVDDAIKTEKKAWIKENEEKEIDGLTKLVTKIVEQKLQK